MSRYRVVFSARADAHLISIALYITEQAGPETAAQILAGLIDRCLGLGDFPARGTPHKRLGKGVRTIPFRRSATIGYTISGQDVVITGVSWRGQGLAVLRDDAEELRRSKAGWRSSFTTASRCIPAHGCERRSSGGGLSVTALAERLCVGARR